MFTLSFTLLSALALADVAPPDDYVETCTVERQCEGGNGIVCGDSYFGDRTACQRAWADKGYARKCSTRGASTWDEVWCASASLRTQPAQGEPVAVDPAPAGSAPADPKPKSNRCSSVDGAAWLALPALLGGLLRRRRQRR